MNEEKIFLVKTKDLGRPLLFIDRKVEFTKEEIEDIKNALGWYGCDLKRQKRVTILLKKMERITTKEAV